MTRPMAVASAIMLFVVLLAALPSEAHYFDTVLPS